MEAVSAHRGRDRLLRPPRRPRSLWDGSSADGDTTERAEDRLARLSGAIGPLRRVLAAIAERLVSTRAYERLCYARLGDYARERAGLSSRQLQDLARVHRALAVLPELEQTLLSNQVPWSKVRLLARVATPEDEGLWIARARTVPTRRLEQDVRALVEPDAGDVLGDAQSDQRISVRCTPAVREKWCLVRDLAERVAGERLRGADALELVAAEAFSAISIDPGRVEPLAEAPAESRCDAAEGTERAAERAATAFTGGLPASVTELAAGLEEADAFELDRRLRLAVWLEQTLDAAIAPLLRVVTSAWYEWSGDYQTLATYAREQLGMSVGKARTLLRLERAGDVCPELREAYRSGRLSWVKAQCLLPLLLLDIEGEWRPAWVAWATRVTVRRLELDVERALLLRAGHHFAWQRCKFHPEKAQDRIPPAERQLCAPDIDCEATQQLEWRVPREVAWLFQAVRETLRARLCSASGRLPLDGQVFDAMLDCALIAWTLRDSKAGRPDPVMERDGYRCVIPGCTSRRNLHDHHISFRSAGGSNELGNRVTLCAFHHLRCLHTGLLRVSGCAPDDLVFELPLARYRSGDIEVLQRSRDAYRYHVLHTRAA